MPSYIYLTLAIISEVMATCALKASGEFSRIGPSIIVILGYLLAFYWLMLSLRTFPLGIAYALWCGGGIVLVSFISFVIFRQRLDLPAILGISFILVGTLIINLFSKNI